MNGTTEQMLRRKYQLLGELFNERERRLWAAVEASQLGRGGISTVARATGLSRTTLYQGLEELGQDQTGAGLSRQRVRSQGGGRQRLTETEPQLLASLEKLVEPTTGGDPESPLRWTCKSTRQLAAVLQEQGHPVGRHKVSELLDTLGYSLQASRKTREGSAHVDRDAQCAHINAQVNTHQQRGQPVLSVDTKKGTFKQTTQKSHRILRDSTASKALSQMLTSQLQPVYKAGFVGTEQPTKRLI